MTRELYEWNKTAALNNFPTADGGMPEGMERSNVNNSGRERMRATREWYDAPEWLDLMRNPTDGSAFVVQRLSATEVRVVSGANDMSAYFNTDRRCRVQTAGGTPTNVLDFHVSSVAYVNPNTDITIDAGNVNAAVDQIWLHHSANIKKLAFINAITNDNFIVPAGFTDADFGSALASAESGGGGTILLGVGTYTIDTTHVIDFPVTIMGKGIGASILKMNTALDKMLHLSGVASTGIDMHNFTIDGDRTGHGSSDGDLIYIDDRATMIQLHDLEIIGGRGSGIFIDNSSVTSNVEDIVISDIVMRDCGHHGIGSADIHTGLRRIAVSNIVVDSPGQRLNDSAGIKAAGEWAISNITVTGLDQGGPFQQRGIWLLDAAASNPNEQDANHCTVSGFLVSGIGAEARGIEIGGRDNVVLGGDITLSGGSAYGIYFGGISASTGSTGNNVASVFVRDVPIAVHFLGSADENMLHGCTFKNTGTYDVEILGQRNVVRGCHSIDATADGVVVKSGAADNVIRDCHFLDTVGTCVDVESGATDTRVGDITMDGAGTAFANADNSTIILDGVDGATYEVFYSGADFDIDGADVPVLLINERLVDAFDGSTVGTFIIGGEWVEDDGATWAWYFDGAALDLEKVAGAESFTITASRDLELKVTGVTSNDRTVEGWVRVKRLRNT